MIFENMDEYYSLYKTLHLSVNNKYLFELIVFDKGYCFVILILIFLICLINFTECNVKLIISSMEAHTSIVYNKLSFKIQNYSYILHILSYFIFASFPHDAMNLQACHSLLPTISRTRSSSSSSLHFSRTQ